MISLYTDGACSGGKVGGWSWLLVDDAELICGNLGRAEHTTNQRMELQAAISALEWLPGWVDVTVVSDSAYLVNCFLDRWYVKWRTNGWVNSKKQPVESRDLWERLLAVVEGRSGVTAFEHVKGHDGDRFNELCDELAVHARTSRPKEK